MSATSLLALGAACLLRGAAAGVLVSALGPEAVPKLMRTEAGTGGTQPQSGEVRPPPALELNSTSAFFETDDMLRMVYDSLRRPGMPVLEQAKLARAPPGQKMLSQMCLLSSQATQETSKAMLVSPEYHQKVRDGLNMVKEKRVIIAGLWRQIGAESVTSLYRSLSALGSFFRDYQMIFIENDSTDSTVQGINEVCQSESRAWCFTLRGLGSQALHQGVKDRVKGLTALRQTLLMKVREFDPGALFDYVLMVDGDIFAEGNGGFDIAGALAAMTLTDSQGINADAVCAFQVVGRTATYYDSFAHRGPVCEYKDLTSQPKCEAQSCGGGMVVYKMKALHESSCKYGYVNEGTCEHVPFNMCLATHGHGKIFLYKPWGIAMSYSGSRSDWNCVSV